MRRSLMPVVLAVLFFSVQVSAQRPELSDLQKKVRAAMEMDYRTEADKERDRNRSPARALEFFRMKDNMKVLEFFPGDGWYTKILAPVLKDKGQLVLGLNPAWLRGEFKELLEKNENFSKVKQMDIGISFDRERGGFDETKLNLSEKDFDMILSIRSYHGFNDAGAAKFNKLAFDALKPGGYFAVIDHTLRHMESETDENGRRRDPVKVIKECLATGFKFVDYSDIFFRADDELRYEVGRKTVTGNTDRFTLLFQKPAR